MNTTTLDPTVVIRLRQFARRRWLLIAFRGVCAALVTFALCMAGVAFLDWGWVLSDNVRWALSGSAYVLTAVVTWWVCLRKLVDKPAQSEVAALLEDTEPALREQLLSAVELATDHPEALHDSPVFRSLLQNQVAQQMMSVRVGRLLPLKLIARWCAAAALVAVMIAALLTSGGTRLRRLAVRAMAPMANVARVSRIQVEILEPTPKSLMVAKDETVAVVVATSGGNVEEAILETFVAGKTPLQQSMRLRTDAEFAANIQVDADEIEYRIIAGDAVTKRYTISGRNRPHVTAFHKTYQYPEYSGRAAETISEDHGDVIVLQGTTAELQLDLDQPVSAAELRIDSSTSDDVTVVPLTQAVDGRWSADVPVDENAIYKVHLVSQETGFENLFSARYEIRPIPDLIPRAGFVDQQETNLLLPPNDILALQGMAEDDLPLETLEQEISVNGRKWVALSLHVSPAETATSEATASASTEDSVNRITAMWNWDLLDLKLKTGDQVMTRLVATDRKGNRGESVPLRIVVSAPDFDPERHAVMERRAALIASIDRLQQVTAEHRKTAEGIVERLKDDGKKDSDHPTTEEQMVLDMDNLNSMAEKIRESAGNVFGELLEVSRTMPEGVDAWDLDLAGRVLLRIASEHTHRIDHATIDFQQAPAEQDKDRRRQVEALKEGFTRSNDDAKSLAYHYRNLVAQDILSAFAWDFNAMRQQQKLVIDSPTQSFDRLKRQETVVMNQLEVVGKLAQQQRRNLPDFLHRHADQLMEWTNRWIANLEQSMESEDRLPELQRHVVDLNRELGDRQRYDVIDGGMPNRLPAARRDLDYRSGSLMEPLSEMSTATHEENRRLLAAATANDSTSATEQATAAAVYSSKIDLKLRPSLEQLRQRRALTQSRVDADAQFAADAGLTHRATVSLLKRYRVGDPRESIVPTAFREIAPAWRILEAGHDIANAQQLLETLIQAERWQSQNFVGISQHPRQFDAFAKALEEAVKKLRNAGVGSNVASKFDELRWSPSSNEARRKITERRWKRDQPVAAVNELVELKEYYAAADELLQPIMADARAIIAKYAPTISEMAEQLAQQVRELEEQTLAAADATSEASPEMPDASDAPTEAPNREQQLAELQQEQEAVNQQLDDLFEALVEDANQRDLSQAEEREKARDADDSVAMVQAPAEQMNAAMQEAQQSEAPDQQAQELSKAAEQQEKTAQALDKVAQHFERMQNNEDLADTRAELRQQEKDLGLARQMDQQFSDVEELQQMTTSSPENLMQQLEEQLKSNPAMQEALSEIAQKTVEQSRNALHDAANQEQELQRANERSDAQFLQKKRDLAEQLRDLGRNASNLANKMVAQADSAASQAKTPEAKQKFEETRKQLQEAANAANQSNENQLLAELAEQAQAAQQAMKAAAESLQEAQKKSADAKDEEIHSEEKRRREAQKKLEDQRKRFADQLRREADQEVKRRDSEERREATNVRNAENNLKKYERDVQQAEQRAKKKPEDQNLKNQIAQAESRKQDAQRKVDAAKEKQQQAQQRENDARSQRDALNQFPQPALTEKNPAAQLAESLASEASKKLDDLNQTAEELANSADFGEQLTPTQQQLAASTDQQQRLGEAVEQTQQNLARAARHEQRLGKNTTAEFLDQAALDVQQVADNEVPNAERQLEAATAAAPDSQKGNADQQESGDNKPALDANAALAASEQALAQQADALTPAIEAAQAANAAAESGMPQPVNEEAASAAASASEDATAGADPPSQPTEGAGQSPPPSQSSSPPSFTPQQMAEGRQLAQTLDELDRAQASPQGDSLTPPASAPPTLTQAAQARAAQLAQQRAQAQQQSQLAQTSENFNPDSIPQTEGQTGIFALTDVNRLEDEDWGKLREQDADNLTKGRREVVAEEYRKSVEAYFKVLAGRSRPGRPGR